jgi:dihydrofolate reductase
MGTLLYSATMSLDGFIAGPDGDMTWMTPYLGPDPAIDALSAATGALLVGRRTFGGGDPYEGTEGEGEAFGGGWSGPQFVLTHDPPDEELHDVTFVTDLRTGVEAALAAARGKLVNVLGADVARQCLAAGLLDEVFVGIAPVLLGDGVRLFDHPGGADVRLERIDVAVSPLATNLRFRVLR